MNKFTHEHDTWDALAWTQHQVGAVSALLEEISNSVLQLLPTVLCHGVLECLSLQVRRVYFLDPD